MQAQYYTLHPKYHRIPSVLQKTLFNCPNIIFLHRFDNISPLVTDHLKIKTNISKRPLFQYSDRGFAHACIYVYSKYYFHTLLSHSPLDPRYTLLSHSPLDPRYTLLSHSPLDPIYTLLSHSPLDPRYTLLSHSP